jgi:ribose 5-phosphate isomerase A
MFVSRKVSRFIRQKVHRRSRYFSPAFPVDIDFRKHSKTLGTSWTQGVPIEIVPLAHTKVINDLLSLGAQNPQLRMGGKAKAGPIITDNGNFIIDAHFGEIVDPEGLAETIKKLVGVVEVGLFINMADAVYFGNEGAHFCHFENAN